jgi:hypothetical protein
VGAIGLSELQALSCARPVIASFRYPTAYPKPPPICQATTADEIIAHLERLHADATVCRELGAQGRAWVAAHHAIPLLAMRLANLYTECLSKRA